MTPEAFDRAVVLNERMILMSKGGSEQYSDEAWEQVRVEICGLIGWEMGKGYKEQTREVRQWVVRIAEASKG